MTEQEIKEIVEICIESLRKNKNLDLQLLNTTNISKDTLYIISYQYKDKNNRDREVNIEVGLDMDFFGKLENTKKNKLDFGKSFISELYSTTRYLRKQYE